MENHSLIKILTSVKVLGISVLNVGSLTIYQVYVGLRIVQIVAIQIVHEVVREVSVVDVGTMPGMYRLRNVTKNIQIPGMMIQIVVTTRVLPLTEEMLITFVFHR